MPKHFGRPFLAEIERLRVEDNVHRMPDGRTLIGGGHRIATAKVLEDFSGYYRPGDEIEVTTGMGGGDCGYPFQQGERYLIDGSIYQDRLYTGICSRTLPESAATLALRELRTVTSGRRVPDVSGTVMRFLSSRGALATRSTPVANVPVELAGLDGSKLRAVTGADGVYEIAVVPPGSYAVDVQLPPELMLMSWEEKKLAIVVPLNDGTGAGCEANVRAYSAGRVAGRVVDGVGDPVQGLLRVYPVAPGSQRWEVSVADQAIGPDGAFRIGPLDAGQYWISFWPKSQEHERWVYPGTQDYTGASAVKVEEGRATEGLVFTILPRP